MVLPLIPIIFEKLYRYAKSAIGTININCSLMFGY